MRRSIVCALTMMMTHLLIATSRGFSIYTQADMYPKQWQQLVELLAAAAAAAAAAAEVGVGGEAEARSRRSFR